MKTIYMDIFLNGKFYTQQELRYSPLFPISVDSVKKTIEDKWRTLKGKDYTIRFSNQKIK
jgi:hypothetical protein|nr:MAG TPA_asm: hypothetical protein [Caudoviricetes sp.]